MLTRGAEPCFGGRGTERDTGGGGFGFTGLTMVWEKGYSLHQGDHDIEAYSRALL